MKYLSVHIEKNVLVPRFFPRQFCNDCLQTTHWLLYKDGSTPIFFKTIHCCNIFRGPCFLCEPSDRTSLIWSQSYNGLWWSISSAQWHFTKEPRLRNPSLNLALSLTHLFVWGAVCIWSSAYFLLSVGWEMNWRRLRDVEEFVSGLQGGSTEIVVQWLIPYPMF